MQGTSPRQKSTEYYNQKEASLLGFLIHYLEDGIIKKVYVDILADNGAQTASAVIRSLNFIKSQNLEKMGGGGGGRVK